MSWIAVGVVGGSVIGGVIQSQGAQSAASTAASAANAGTNAQLSMFDTTQANFKPQIQLGQGAANMLSGIYGTGTNGAGSQPNANYSNFYNSPGYQFSLGQGESAINKSAASQGGLYSTGTAAALGGFASGAASTQYNSYINQLLSMAGMGNAAASGVGSAATATGQGVANTLQNAGNANAAGILGSSNAFSSALGSATNSNLLSSLYNNGSTGYAPGAPAVSGTGYGGSTGGYLMNNPTGGASAGTLPDTPVG